MKVSFILRISVHQIDFSLFGLPPSKLKKKKKK